MNEKKRKKNVTVHEGFGIFYMLCLPIERFFFKLLYLSFAKFDGLLFLMHHIILFFYKSVFEVLYFVSTLSIEMRRQIRFYLLLCSIVWISFLYRLLLLLFFVDHPMNELKQNKNIYLKRIFINMRTSFIN